MPDEEPFAVYDEDEIPGNKASEILESPMLKNAPWYLPSPYRYLFKGRKIDRELFNDLEGAVKEPELLKKELKTHAELTKEIIDDQDGFARKSLYDAEWDFFAECLTQYMHERHGGDWETPCGDFWNDTDENCYKTNKKAGTGSRRLSVSDGHDLLHAVCMPPSTAGGLLRAAYVHYGRISISGYKKTVREPLGMGLIISTYDRDIPLLPACHDGFVRDWDKDGICIAVEREVD